MLDFSFENSCRAKGYVQVIGCDEVGRGCLAGPVVAAAIILPTELPASDTRDIIRDSKTLSRAQRQDTDAYLRMHALAFAIGEVSVAMIDTRNIHHATLLAMRRALARVQLVFHTKQAYVAVDGRFRVPGVRLPQEAIIDGDAKVLSIAAASIIAKEYRDQLMERLDQKYPGYGLAQHKGYGTPQHRMALQEKGLTPIHRKTFCHL